MLRDKIENPVQEEGDETETKSEREPPVLPVFNLQEAETAFDNNYPQIIIPLEVIEDVDSDWPLTEEEEADLIQAYFTK